MDYLNRRTNTVFYPISASFLKRDEGLSNGYYNGVQSLETEEEESLWMIVRNSSSTPAIINKTDLLAELNGAPANGYADLNNCIVWVTKVYEDEVQHLRKDIINENKGRTSALWTIDGDTYVMLTKEWFSFTNPHTDLEESPFQHYTYMKLSYDLTAVGIRFAATPVIYTANMNEAVEDWIDRKADEVVGQGQNPAHQASLDTSWEFDDPKHCIPLKQYTFDNWFTASYNTVIGNPLYRVNAIIDKDSKLIYPMRDPYKVPIINTG
jgi:hypothetical protein